MVFDVDRMVSDWVRCRTGLDVFDGWPWVGLCLLSLLMAWVLWVSRPDTEEQP